MDFGSDSGLVWNAGYFDLFAGSFWTARLCAISLLPNELFQRRKFAGIGSV